MLSNIASRYRYQPQPVSARQTWADYLVSQHILAAIIGIVAIGLPLVLLLASAIYTCRHDSMSHYYYSRFLGDVFVGSLIIIGTFLIAYRGENSREKRYASIAGVCAYGVAVFPTVGSGLQDGLQCTGRQFYSTDQNSIIEQFELFRGVGVLHYISAGILFAFLAYYSLRVFTRVIPGEQEDAPGKLSPQKKLRNGMYYASGGVILVSMTALGSYAIGDWQWWRDHDLTFWFEAFAVWAFGISWIVKGRFFNSILLDERDKRQEA